MLTYPQCDVSKEDMMEFLQALPKVPKFIIVCEEKHEDGSPHLHAVLQWERKLDTRDERYFDYDTFHPNIGSCRALLKAIEYAKKDGCFITWGDEPTQAEVFFDLWYII